LSERPDDVRQRPINFDVAAARFTGAPLIVASASAADGGLHLVQQEEDLVVDASDGLEEAGANSSRREFRPSARCPVIVLPRGVEASLDALMEVSPGAATAVGP
jgi:hypothetical protein